MLAALTTFLLQDALRIQVHPFSLHEGWKPFLAWWFIFSLTVGFYQRLMRRFVPPVPPLTAVIPPGDLYTSVQAEIAAERVASKR